MSDSTAKTSVSSDVESEASLLQEKLSETHLGWNLKLGLQKMRHGEHICSIAVNLNFNVFQKMRHGEKKGSIDSSD